MATLTELKNELRKEKNKTAALQELREIGVERRKLKKEIKSLRRRRKFAGTIRVGKAIARGATAAKRSASAISKAINRAEARAQAKARAKSRIRGKPGATLAGQDSFESTISQEIPQ